MQVNLTQCHSPTPWNVLHALTAFKSTHTVKPDPKIQIILRLNTFSPSNSSTLEHSSVYSLYIWWVFWRFVKFKIYQSPFWKTILHQKDDSDRTLDTYKSFQFPSETSFWSTIFNDMHVIVTSGEVTIVISGEVTIAR